MRTFEAACADTQRAAETAAKATSALVVAARQLVKAAQEGDVAKIRRLNERLGQVANTARQEVANARSSWPYAPDEEEAYLRTQFEAELLDHASRSNLKLFKADDRLVAFPSVVRILPSDRAVKVDRKRITTLRPSVLTAMLRANQARKARSTSDRFLEALFRAYRLVAGQDRVGSTVRLSEIYESFTLLPGTSGEYAKTDFARDLFLLDRSGLSHTKANYRVSLPASTGTKGAKDVFQFVAPDGETVTYYGVRFIQST